MRPLLCFDKEEIVRVARKIGTYETSIEPSICCNVVPKFPVTRASLSDLEVQEVNLDVDKLIEERMKDIEVIEV